MEKPRTNRWQFFNMELHLWGKTLTRETAFSMGIFFQSAKMRELYTSQNHKELAQAKDHGHLWAGPFLHLLSFTQPLLGRAGSQVRYAMTELLSAW